MSDITQSMGDLSKIVFSANTPRADIWMRENYAAHTVELERSEAKEFKALAEEAGLVITSL